MKTMNTQVEQIKAEVERLKETVGAGLDAYDMGHENGAFEAYEKVISFIDSLPEETSKDLEEEIEAFSDYSNLLAPQSEIKLIAYYFAHWQKEQLIEKACEWLLKNVRYYSTNALGAEYMCNDFRKAMEGEK